MKKLFGSLALWLALSGSASAQNPTAVTGTITDPNSVAYYPAQVTACLSPVTSRPTVGGQLVNPNIGTNYCIGPVSTAANGSFSMGLHANTNITPGGTTWIFTITTLGAAPPAGTGSQTFQSSGITISGASQDVGATLSALAPKLLAGGSSVSPGSAAIAGNTNSTYLSPACPQPSSGNCFFANFDLQYALGDVTCNNGSSTISIASAPITSFAISSNVVTFQVVNSFVLATSVYISGLSTGTYLNNQLLRIASVSGTQFTAAFTHADVNSTVDAGFATTDPPFTYLLNGQTTAVGLVIAGGDGINTHGANCPPQGTITSLNSPVSVQVSVPATISVTTGRLGWGHNDGAAINTAFLASLGKGCLYLPQGNAWFDTPPFLDNRSTATKGPPTCVVGTGQSMITPLPTFNYSNCITGGACVFTWGNGANQNPNYALLKDWTVFGLDYQLTGTGTTNFVMNLQRVTEENVWIWHWGNSIGVGKNYLGPVSSFSSITDSSGVINCNVSGTGGNQTVQFSTPFCGENGQSIAVAAGAFLESFGGQYGPGGGAGQAENVAGHWFSSGEVHFQPGNTQDTIRIAATGSLILDDAQVFGGASNTLGSIDCNGSGGNVQLRGKTTISGAPASGGTAGVAIRSIAGCNINNDSGGLANVISGTFSLSGNNIGQTSETQTGTCSANAATVTFKNVYSLAPLVLVSDTTSGSTGAQATASNTTTATIHCNGATDTFVATVIPNPI